MNYNIEANYGYFIKITNKEKNLEIILNLENEYDYKKMNINQKINMFDYLHSENYLKIDAITYVFYTPKNKIFIEKIDDNRFRLEMNIDKEDIMFSYNKTTIDIPFDTLNIDAEFEFDYNYKPENNTKFKDMVIDDHKFTLTDILKKQNIKERFIEKFPIKKGNKKNPYIILFDAYTGQGKSYVSKIISKIDNSVILNNDEVRKFINDYDDTTDLKDRLQRYRLELLLKNNNSCIMDSCFCHNYLEKLKYYDTLGYKYYIIRLKCSDDTVKERLNKRINDYSNATYDDYLWMKSNVSHVDNNLIDYTIDTEKDIEEQVKKFLNNIEVLNDNKRSN